MEATRPAALQRSNEMENEFRRETTLLMREKKIELRESARDNGSCRRDGEEAKEKMRAARSERDVFLRVLYFLRYGSRELIFFCENSAQI